MRRKTFSAFMQNPEFRNFQNFRTWILKYKVRKTTVFVREITLQLSQCVWSQITIHQLYRQTDRQTDRRHTIAIPRYASIR